MPHLKKITWGQPHATPWERRLFFRFRSLTIKPQLFKPIKTRIKWHVTLKLIDIPIYPKIDLLYKTTIPFVKNFDFGILFHVLNMQFVNVVLFLWMFIVMVRLIVFKAIFNNISVISWRSVFLVEETGEDYRPVVSHWQIVSHKVVSSTPYHEQESNSQL